MPKSTLFLSFAILFLLLSGYFGHNYFSGNQAKEDVPQLLMTISNLVLSIAMFILSRNKAFRK